jgi:hypothetical protein
MTKWKVSAVAKRHKHPHDKTPFYKEVSEYCRENNIIPCRLSQYSSKSACEEHTELCVETAVGGSVQITCMPIPKKPTLENPTLGPPITKFTGYRKQQIQPIVIYANFECLNKPVGNEHDAEANTARLTEHVACSYRFLIKPTFGTGDLQLDYHYVGKDAAEHFVHTLLSLEETLKHSCSNSFKDVDNFIITAEQDVQYRAAAYARRILLLTTLMDPVFETMTTSQACSWELHKVQPAITGNQQSPPNCVIISQSQLRYPPDSTRSSSAG